MDSSELRIERGNVYLPAEVYERFFAGLTSVALLIREGQLLLLPVHSQAFGGLIIKVLNARGDRVIQAQEFFRQYLSEDQPLLTCQYTWSSQWSGLLLQHPGLSQVFAPSWSPSEPPG